MKRLSGNPGTDGILEEYISSMFLDAEAKASFQARLNLRHYLVFLDLTKEILGEKGLSNWMKKLLTARTAEERARQPDP